MIDTCKFQSHCIGCDLDRSFEATFGEGEHQIGALGTLVFCLQPPVPGFATLRSKSSLYRDAPVARNTHKWRLGCSGSKLVDLIARFDPFQG